MSTRTIRFLIYFFLALIGIFFLLMLINFIGSHAGKRSDAAAVREEGGIAGLFYGMYKYDRTRKTTLPSARQGLSTASVRSEGAIMLVRDEKFSGVAEKPKTGMDALVSLGGGGKKGPPPVSLRDGAVLNKITAPVPEPQKASAAMPELGGRAGQGGVTLITAPVDYKVFKSSAVWQAFAAPRRIKDIRHDFSSADLLILFSVSDFPNGIFKVIGVERSGKETVVKYRVDPLAMSAEAEQELRETYASAPVPRKGPPIRLVQVP